MATADAHIPTGASVAPRIRSLTPDLGGHGWLALSTAATPRTVETSGAVLERTSSGPAFVRRLHELRPRLAIVVAPPAGTPELLAAIRERRQRATLRIVYLNEVTAIQGRLAALALGFDDALPVTIDPAELIAEFD